MPSYRYFLVGTSLGWHKVLPDASAVLLCPTTLSAQTQYFAGHFCYLARLGPDDRQPSEGHRRLVCRVGREIGLPFRPPPSGNDPWAS